MKVYSGYILKSNKSFEIEADSHLIHSSGIIEFIVKNTQDNSSNNFTTIAFYPLKKIIIDSIIDIDKISSPENIY